MSSKATTVPNPPKMGSPEKQTYSLKYRRTNTFLLKSYDARTQKSSFAKLQLKNKEYFVLKFHYGKILRPSIPVVLKLGGEKNSHEGRERWQLSSANVMSYSCIFPIDGILVAN